MHKLLMVAALAAGTIWVAAAQSDSPPAQGRGRGGAPYAWNDKDKDGICDITGRPVGQGPGAGRGFAAGGRGQGRWAGRGRGPCGRGAAWGRGPATPAPTPQSKQ